MVSIQQVSVCVGALLLAIVYGNVGVYASDFEEAQVRVRRQVPGGHSEIDSDDPEVQKLVSHHKSDILARCLCFSEPLSADLTVTKAQRQVVAGTNYSLKLTIENAQSVSKGRAVGGTKPKECEIKIWKKLGGQGSELTHPDECTVWQL